MFVIQIKCLDTFFLKSFKQVVQTSGKERNLLISGRKNKCETC